MPVLFIYSLVKLILYGSTTILMGPSESRTSVTPEICGVYGTIIRCLS